MSLQICNKGTGYITFVNPGLGGDDVLTWLDENFSVSQADRDKLKNTVLGPGKPPTDPNAPSCVTIDVTFTAQKKGAYKTTARLWASTRDCRDTSVWSAVISRPGPQMTGYDWKERWVTTRNSCTKSTIESYETLISLLNDGTSTYTVQSLEIVGPDASYFQIDNSDSLTSVQPGLAILPGPANQRFQKVLFTPDAERSYSAMLRLTNNFEIVEENLLQGAGIESHIALAGSDFGNVEFKGTEPTTVSGNVNLITEPTRPTTITGITLSGPDVAEFRFNWSTATAPYNYHPTPLMPWVNIPPGMVILIPMEFAPSAPGRRTAYLTVHGDFSKCDTSTIPLTGNAVTSLSVSGDASDRVSFSADDAGTFTFTLPHAVAVTLDLHDASGNRVARVADGMMDAGTHRIAINNGIMASGVYLYRFSCGGAIRTGRVTVVR